MNPALRLMAASGTAWTPAQLSPALWFDASVASSITASSGAVSQWNDISGNARHATQASGPSQPLTGSYTQNGLNVVHFDGADLLSTASLGDIYTGLTAVGVVKHDSTAARHLWIDFVGSANIVNDSVGSTVERFTTDANRTTTKGGTISTTNYQLWVARMGDGNSAATRLRCNGTTVVDSTRASSALDPAGVIALGRHASNATIGLVGKIAEVLVFATSLSDSDVAQLESYLNAKWAVY